jgi:hypothetical protein
MSLVTSAILRKPRRSLRRIGALLMGAGLVGGFFVTDGAFAPFVGGVVIAIGLGVFFARSNAKERRGQLRVDASGISLDDETLLDRSDVSRGAEVETVGRRTFALVTRRGPIELEVRDHETAAALVTTLLGLRVTPRFAAYRRRAGSTMPIALRALIAVMGMAALAFAVGLYNTSIGLAISLAVATVGLLLPIVILVLLVVFVVRRATVHVGADGLVIASLGGSTVLSFADIERVVRRGVDLTFCLRDGRKVAVGFGFSPASAEMAPLVRGADALTSCIEEARSAYAEAALEARAVPAALARGQHDIVEWIQALGALADERAHFRSAALGTERLWRVLEDASQPAATRAAAAVALRSTLDDEARTRLIRVSDTCAAPRLRVVLEAATSTDDPPLVAALDALVQEEDTRLRARKA